MIMAMHHDSEANGIRVCGPVSSTRGQAARRGAARHRGPPLKQGSHLQFPKRGGTSDPACPIRTQWHPIDFNDALRRIGLRSCEVTYPARWRISDDRRCPGARPPSSCAACCWASKSRCSVWPVRRIWPRTRARASEALLRLFFLGGGRPQGPKACRQTPRICPSAHPPEASRLRRAVLPRGIPLRIVFSESSPLLVEMSSSVVPLPQESLRLRGQKGYQGLGF
jgi:hypothetical protein